MGVLAHSVDNIEKTILFAREKGLSIIPVNEHKVPLVKWKKYQKKPADAHEMLRWVGIAQGIALVTGSVSGIIVLDVDVKNGKNGMKHLKDKHLPITPAVRTPNGGTHYYYKCPKDAKFQSIIGLYEGVDVKAEGGYVLMPFTPGYEWYEGLEFNSVPLADIPKWLLEELQNRANKRSKQVSKSHKTSAEPIKKVHAEQVTNLGQDVKQYFKDEEAVKQMLPLLGLKDVEIGSSFKCILPTKKPDNHPSASLYRGKNGVIVYRDWRASEDEPDYYTLPEVYASLKYKEKRKLEGPELATWALRMLVDSGILDVKPIEAPELPESLRKKKAVNAVYEGFKYLLAVKKLYKEEQNRTAFSYRFGAAWCGLSLRSVQNAMMQLEAFGYIQRVGKEGKGTRAVNVYQLNIKKS
jgi:Bifunctional DNA primase/polymerase, N-terminal